MEGVYTNNRVNECMAIYDSNGVEQPVSESPYM
jgi:hypothetical protein